MKQILSLCVGSITYIDKSRSIVNPNQARKGWVISLTDPGSLEVTDNTPPSYAQSNGKKLERGISH